MSELPADEERRQLREANAEEVLAKARALVAPKVQAESTDKRFAQRVLRAASRVNKPVFVLREGMLIGLATGLTRQGTEVSGMVHQLPCPSAGRARKVEALLKLIAIDYPSMAPEKMLQAAVLTIQERANEVLDVKRLTPEAL